MSVLHTPKKVDAQTSAEQTEADLVAQDHETHYISKSQNQRVPIFSFIQDEDPAKVVSDLSS